MIIIVNVSVVHCDNLIPETSVDKSSGMDFIVSLCALHSRSAIVLVCRPYSDKVPPPAL